METKKAVSSEEAKEVKTEINSELLKIIQEMKKEIEQLKSEKTVAPIVFTKDSIERGKREISDEMQKEINSMEEKVLFQPMYDGDKYKDDIFVSVNCKPFVINRMEAYKKPVKIPRYIYNVIKESEKNLVRLNSVKNGLANRYEEKKDNLNY